MNREKVTTRQSDMDRLEIKEAIVVEGRDDTAALRKVTDALIIETHGFGIKRETWELLEKAYREKGLIILTDPDFSGEEIRRRLTERFPESRHSYMPRAKALKNGDIGVENASPEDIAKVLAKVCTPSHETTYTKFTQRDMDEAGLAGGAESRGKRQQVGEILGIGYGNSGTFIKKLNSFGEESLMRRSGEPTGEGTRDEAIRNFLYKGYKKQIWIQIFQEPGSEFPDR